MTRNKRTFRASAAVVLVALALCSSAANAEDLPLRIVAANLTSGKDPNYDLGHGERILKALKPDVVLIQEFNLGDQKPATLDQWVDQTFAEEYVYYREENARIPNGIISRFPIKAAGEVPDPAQLDRDFAWAQIDLPNTQRDLWAISVHFHTKKGSRVREAEAVLSMLKELKVPEQDYVALGGDFNTDGPNEECLVVLRSAFGTGAPQPNAKNGKTGTNIKLTKPYDWVFADADLAKQQVATVVAGEKFPNGLIFDTRLLGDQQVSELKPVRQDDSGAKGMQHMAVIKDFAIPPD